MSSNLFDWSFQFTHLDEEVEHIAAPKLKEAGFTENDVLAMLARMDKYVKSHGDPFVVVPYMRRFVSFVHLHENPPNPPQSHTSRR
jgi:hypothetical protein